MTAPRYNQWKITPPKPTTYSITYKVPLFITVDTPDKNIVLYNNQYDYCEAIHLPAGIWKLRLTHNSGKVELETELVGEYIKPHWRG